MRERPWALHNRKCLIFGSLKHNLQHLYGDVTNYMGQSYEDMRIQNNYRTY